MEEKKKAAYQRGVQVFVGLAILTIIEFLVAGINSVPLMLVIGLIKAFLIVTYFMNISRLWREDGH